MGLVNPECNRTSTDTLFLAAWLQRIQINQNPASRRLILLEINLSDIKDHNALKEWRANADIFAIPVVVDANNRLMRSIDRTLAISLNRVGLRKRMMNNSLLHRVGWQPLARAIAAASR